MRFKTGFALLETLIVLFILTLLALATYFTFSSFKNKQILNSGVEVLLSVLHDARTRTIASRSNTQYGVNFQSDRLVLFQGASYPGVTVNEVLLDKDLMISNINFAGGASVVFKRLSGATDNTGTVTLGLKFDPSRLAVIQVHASGLFGVE